MKFYPYRKLVFNSPLSENEVRNRLNCLTRASNAFHTKYYPNIKTSDYNGDVYANTFEVSRIIAYRNSFLPHIKGNFGQNVMGTTIIVTMRLNWFVMAFGGLWFGGVFLALVVSCFGTLINPVGLLIPFGMLIFGYLLFTVPFIIEAGITTKDFARIFECQPDGEK